MQDNPNIQSFDKKFVNDSWNQLKSQLDKEQPVIKDSKKTWITSLVLLQLLSMGVIGYLYYQNKNLAERPFSELTKTEVIVESVTETITETKYVDREVLRYIDLSPISFNINALDLEYDLGALMSMHSSTRSASPKEANKLSDYSPLTELPSSSISLAEKNSKVDLSTGYDLGFIKDPFIDLKKLKFGIGLVTNVTNDLDYTGAGILASVMVPISEKFSLSTGIGYNQLSRETVFMPFFRKKNLPNYKSIELPETFYDNLIDLNQIFIPFSVTYNATNKVGILAGLNFRHTFQSNVYFNLENRLKTHFTGVNEPLDLYFNNTNIGLSLGIDYQFNNNWSMRLDSEWGHGLYYRQRAV